MKKTTIDAVATVRRIRDAQHEKLRDMTPEERIRFYRAKAGRVLAPAASQPLEPQVSTETRLH